MDTCFLADVFWNHLPGEPVALGWESGAGSWASDLPCGLGQVDPALGASVRIATGER